ncbi:methyl-accepting chemotaxis protein [Metabacillus halosaccharovorans]|uniref:methyl-accepting chemotaxis protein n=1 Tax=Metabacillus halosaccharovorans TaxID=930124 RepID=UPI001C1F886C|nr:methyl-accepting chemotaxis protein [Metabacillus halosaccharovorans]MBU7591262.1 methyl-accepting chemotaxis protein [Metabacillus halosaccharovorans]
MKAHPKLSDLSLRKRIIFVFLVILLLLATINCVQIYLFLGYVRQYNAMMETIKLTNSINGSLKQKLDEEIRDIAYGKVLFENGTQYDHLNNMYHNLDKIEQDDKNSQFAKEISEVRQTLTTTTEYIDKLGEQIQENAPADTRNITYEYITILTDLIDEKVQSLLQKTLLVKGESQNIISINLKRDITIYICAFISVIMISIFFAIYISGSFVKPIRHLGQKTNEIAEGNLTIGAITYPYKNEIGELCRSYNRMFQNLKDIILSVRRTNDLVVLTSKDIHQSILENRLAGEEVAEATQKISTNLHTQDQLIQNSVSTFEHLLFKYNEILGKSNKINLQSNETLHITNKITSELITFHQQLGHMRKMIYYMNTESEELQKLSGEVNENIRFIKLVSKEFNLLYLSLLNEMPNLSENQNVSNTLTRLKKISDETDRVSQQSDDKTNDISRLSTSIRKQNSETLKNIQASKIITEEIQSGFKTILSIRSKQQVEIESIKQDMQEAFDQMLSVRQMISDIEQSSQITNAELAGIASMGEEQLTTLEEVSDSSYKLVERIQEMKDNIRQFKI